MKRVKKEDSPRNMSYGDYVRISRTATGKTLKEVARELGFSVSYLSEVELGRRGPLSKEKNAVLAKVLGCDLGVLRALALLLYFGGEVVGEELFTQLCKELS